MNQARIWNDDGQMEAAVQVTEIISFALSFSDVVILPKYSITFACLPACCPPRPEEEMERFSSDSGRPVLWAKVGLMNKPYTV